MSLFEDRCYKRGLACPRCEGLLRAADGFGVVAEALAAREADPRWRVIAEAMWRTARGPASAGVSAGGRGTKRARDPSGGEEGGGGSSKRRAPEPTAPDPVPPRVARVARVARVLASEGAKVGMSPKAGALAGDLILFARSLMYRAHPDKNGGAKTGVDMAAVANAAASLKKRAPPC